MQGQSAPTLASPDHLALDPVAKLKPGVLAPEDEQLDYCEKDLSALEPAAESSP